MQSLFAVNLNSIRISRTLRESSAFEGLNYAKCERAASCDEVSSVSIMLFMGCEGGSIKNGQWKGNVTRVCSELMRYEA
jgi:hypothetical protein